MAPNFGDVRLPDRFWDKVAPCPMSGCWLWMASANNSGYGEFNVKTPAGTWRTSLSHRVAYEATVGAIQLPELDHLCRTTLCCNPSHLEPVTRKENARRSTAGIVAGQRQRSKTHCPHGHSYSGDNLYESGGKRHCRACRARDFKNFTTRIASRKTA